MTAALQAFAQPNSGFFCHFAIFCLFLTFQLHVTTTEKAK